MNDIARNNYIRSLSKPPEEKEYIMPYEDGNIMVTADGYRLRIERGVTVADLIHIGDVVETNYSPPSIVIKVTKYVGCTCPYSPISRTLVCHPHWDGPTITTYHREVICWSIVMAHPGAKQNKQGEFYDDSDYGYINELVATPDGRILHLFENNNDEVFVRKDKIKNQKPVQFRLI